MRVSRAELSSLVGYLNRLLGTDKYFLEVAYGQPRLCEKVGAGVRDVSPRLPNGELYRWIHAFLAGIDVGTARQMKGSAQCE